MLAIYLIGYVICVWVYFLDISGDEGHVTLGKVPAILLCSLAWPLVLPFMLAISEHVGQTVIYRRKK